MDRLEQTVMDMRARYPMRSDENLIQYDARVYHLAIMYLEQTKDELPNVKAVQERSKQASKRAGRPEKVSDVTARHPKEDE
jgi:hypothetical protein